MQTIVRLFTTHFCSSSSWSSTDSMLCFRSNPTWAWWQRCGSVRKQLLSWNIQEDIGITYLSHDQNIVSCLYNSNRFTVNSPQVGLVDPLVLGISIPLSSTHQHSPEVWWHWTGSNSPSRVQWGSAIIVSSWFMYISCTRWQSGRAIN